MNSIARDNSFGLFGGQTSSQPNAPVWPLRMSPKLVGALYEGLWQ